MNIGHTLRNNAMCFHSIKFASFHHKELPVAVNICGKRFGYVNDDCKSLSIFNTMMNARRVRELSDLAHLNNIEHFPVLFLFEHKGRYYTNLNDFHIRHRENSENTLKHPYCYNWEDRANSIYGYWRFDYE